MQVETTQFENINKKICENGNFKTKLDILIDSVVKNKDFINPYVNKKRISPDGGNYLGNLYEIDIKGETGSGYKEIAIFCKAMTEDPVELGFISLQNVYNMELFAYTNLSRTINELQDEANIPGNERYNTVKCYNESNEQMLLMENLSRKGFKTWYRMDIVSLEMAEVCVKQLARFHGMSFAMEQLRSKYFNNNIKNIKPPVTFNKEWTNYFDKFYKIGLNLLDDETRSKVGDKLRKILAKYSEYVTDTSSYYCLCHGDFRPNNILVKEVDGKVVDAVPVDYQLMYYGCPVLDFIYFIYMGTDYNFRKAHIGHLKKLYYNSLDNHLQRFDISVESVFPRKLFENLYEEKWDYGVMVMFFYCPYLFVAEDTEVPDVTKENVNNIEFKFDDKFRVRMEDLIQEYIDMGLL